MPERSTSAPSTERALSCGESPTATPAAAVVAVKRMTSGIRSTEGLIIPLDTCSRARSTYPPAMPKRVFITAFEASGDQHAAELIRSLRQLDPTIEIEGGDEN